MTNYIGEFDCKLDAKGRMMLPTGLLKQFPDNLKERFVVNRSVFQKCLVLNPMDAWEELVKDLSKLNRFTKENDDFIRQYNNGAVQVELDSANRILIPKRLLDYAKIEKDVVLTANLNKIEIWSAAVYDQVMNSYDPDSFAALAEKVMGDKSTPNTGNNGTVS
jgi:MraZ protein